MLTVDAGKSELTVWIEELIRERYGTWAAVAKIVGLSQSAMSRQIRTGTLGLKPLLKLALATGEPASEVLARAGKRDLADLIETVYGAPRDDADQFTIFAERLRRLNLDTSDLALLNQLVDNFERHRAKKRPVKKTA